MNGRHAIVIGGGVIGASCAYALSKAGWRVTVVEGGEFGKGCSHANCGFVCPSHILPLAEPGAAWNAFKSMFRRNSPVKVRMRFDPALWGWLWRFARRCNTADMLDAGRAIQALLASSRKLYAEWLSTEGFDCEWQTRGLLFVFQSPAEMEAYAHTDQLLGEHFGMRAVRYGSEEVAKLEPALKPGMAGGWHYEGDAHLRPDRLMANWRRVLSNRGVTIREKCDVHGFLRSDRRAHTLVASTVGVEPFTPINIEADAFVVATGAWTPLLGKHLGCRVPIQPGKGYSITMARPSHCPTIPLIFPQTHVAVTPMQSGYRLGSTMEFAGYDRTIDPQRLQLLRDGAIPYLKEPFCEPVEEEWFGWRPMTYDGKPIIGPCPKMENVFIAAGHNMLGLSMAPATGQLVAELLSGKPPHVDPKPYSVERF
jgi:D-amino-acid dehydrogenase